MADALGKAGITTVPKVQGYMVETKPDKTVVALQGSNGNNFNVNTGVIKRGEKLKVDVTEQGLVAEKTGPDRYEKFKAMVGDAVSSTTGTIVDGINGLLGTDPVVTLQSGLKASSAVVSNLLAPAEIVTAATSNIFQVFRVITPFIDALKLVDTVKSHNQEIKSSHPKGLGKLFGSSHGLNMIVDSTKLLFDTALAVGVVGAFIGYAPITSHVGLPTLLTAGFIGDWLGATAHGVGATEQLTNPGNGQSFAERFKTWANTRGIGAMIRRVFKGEEPAANKAN